VARSVFIPFYCHFNVPAFFRHCNVAATIVLPAHRPWPERREAHTTILKHCRNTQAKRPEDCEDGRKGPAAADRFDSAEKVFDERIRQCHMARFRPHFAGAHGWNLQIAPLFLTVTLLAAVTATARLASRMREPKSRSW